VRDGVVLAVGAEADVRTVAGARADVVDLDGGALLPGFRDGHAHPLWGGIELDEAPVRDCTSVDEIVAAVRAYADANPDLEWVLGGSYDPSLAPSGLFDARWLDAAVPDRPIYLESSDHHCAWVNSEALRRAGVTADSDDPPAAYIARRADGQPLGTLVEWTAMELVRQHVPEHDDEAKRRAVAASTGMLAEAGVVWAQDAALAPEDVQVYLDSAEAGELAVRINVALRAEPGEWPEQRAEFAAARAAAVGSPEVSVRTVKFFADGVIEAGTGAMLEPYVDAPHSCGLPVWDPAELAEAVTAFDADGFQVHIHTIGDAAVRTALDAIEAAVAANGPRDRRPVLAHVQVVDPADLPRFAALGVIANFEPLWAQLDDCQTELTIPRLGAARAALQYPMAALLATGARLSFGSDWPVTSHRPLDGLAVAAGGTWPPGQRLPPEAAIAAYTAGSAHQAFEDDVAGALLPGSRADLAVLSADPYAMPASEWADIDVVGAWVGGRRNGNRAERRNFPPRQRARPWP
jgi:predicted amidohydrolase YtcJ